MAKELTKAEIAEIQATTVKFENDFVTLRHLVANNLDYAGDIRSGNQEIGEILYRLKSEYPSTKVFGEVVASQVPGITDVRLISDYIKLAGHGKGDAMFPAEFIAEWLDKNKPDCTSPKTCWMHFWKAHKPVDKDKEPGEVTDVEPEPETGQTVAETYMKKLESLYAELDKVGVELTAAQRQRVKEIGNHFRHFANSFNIEVVVND